MASKKTQTPEIDIGIAEGERKKIVTGLSALLADSYTLYLMTHNFHWNVTGPQFNSLHIMFMNQYTEQWNALDVIAERIRALGFPAPGTYKEFVKLASIKEVEGAPRPTTWFAISSPPRKPLRAPHASCSTPSTRPTTSRLPTY